MTEAAASVIADVTRPTADQLARAQLPTATLHEASGKLGALPSAISALDLHMGVCGPAVTVVCPPGDNLRLHQALYIAHPGDVLVVDVSGAYEHGYWGEILTVAAQAAGLGGLVIDGGVRDRDRLIELRFPVFARRVCIRGTTKTATTDGTINHPIRIGGVDIQPGDLVVGDSDGVVAVGRHSVDRVIAASLEREANENLQMEALRTGGRTLDLFGLPGP